MHLKLVGMGRNLLFDFQSPCWTQIIHANLHFFPSPHFCKITTRFTWHDLIVRVVIFTTLNLCPHNLHPTSIQPRFLSFCVWYCCNVKVEAPSIQTKQPNGEVMPLVNPDLQLVPAQKLLELLWPPDCRPSLRWLRDQQKRRRIPSVKLGHLVFFIPADVRNSFRESAHSRKILHRDQVCVSNI